MGHDIQRVLLQHLRTAGDCLCCHHDGKWKCRSRSCGGRGIQSGSFPVGTGIRKRNRSYCLAMGPGLVAGMGYLGYAFLVAVILGGVTLLYNKVDFGAGKKAALYKTLHITIPENLDYTGVFDKILKQYTKTYEVVQVKTTNMRSLFKLTYNITLKNAEEEKALIDALRCRNGNLEISVSKQETIIGEL